MKTCSDEKRCSRCKGWFPRTNEYFSRNAASPDGLYGQCKPCDQETKRKYREQLRGGPMPTSWEELDLIGATDWERRKVRLCAQRIVFYREWKEKHKDSAKAAYDDTPIDVLPGYKTSPQRWHRLATIALLRATEIQEAA